MGPALAAALLLGTAMPVLGKALCPPGRFEIHTTEPGAAFDGAELVLGRGLAELGSACAAVRAGQYLRRQGMWLYRVRARWPRCDGRRLALRAHWDFEAAYCTRLKGLIRSGARA